MAFIRLSAALVGFVFLSLAWTRVTLAASVFGAEFTMTNNYIYVKGLETGDVATPETRAAQKQLLDEFTKTCLATHDCEIEEVLNKYREKCYRVVFKAQGGFWLQISTDPSVVEIQSKPSTLDQYIQAQPILDDLFEAGKRIGIAPRLDGGGGGHIHMDFASTFGNDARLFRNFLVDFANHQELAGAGVLGADTMNAPALVLLSSDQKAEFRKIIEEFDDGQILTARELSKAINSRVYRKVYGGEKHQALNLIRMYNADGDSTLEFRGISPQRSSDEFIKELRLFESRVEYLRKNPAPLKLLDLDQMMSEREKVAAFRAYVEESDLKWADYRPLVRNSGKFTTHTVLPLSRSQWGAQPLESNRCAGFFVQLLQSLR